MKITIIIPTYNEIENLGKIVEKVFSLPLPDLSILIVDDNSPDGTGGFADGLAEKTPGRIHVLHRPGKMGLGSAYIQGFKIAIDNGADAACQMDADFSHPIEKIVNLAEALKSCDIAIGSRYVPGGSLDENWPIWRKALSGWGNFYARTILNMKLRDVTGGFRLWRREVLQNMPLHRVKSNGYVFQVETAYLASKLGYSFHEIPIHFAERRQGKSKMSFRIQLEAAIRVWQLLFSYQDIPAKK